MSAIGPKQTFDFASRMSAFEGKADMTFCSATSAIEHRKAPESFDLVCRKLKQT
jgi:hypothetical protein